MSGELCEMLYLEVERVRGRVGQLWPDGILETLERSAAASGLAKRQ